MSKKIKLKKLSLRFLIIVLILFFGAIFLHNFPKKDLSCQNLNSQSEKLICWEQLIEKTLKTHGIDKAFEIVETLYKEDPIFVSNCHDFVHLIGGKAYLLFTTNQQFNLSDKTSYCGFGFYHAFMEALILDGADLAKAGEFCDYVDTKMHAVNADAKGACFHGIGHGVADNHDQKEWNSEEDLTEKALALCKNVSPDDTLLNRCSSGVFNVLAIAYNNNKLKINPNDPLWYCRGLQNDIYKKTCFEEMNTALFVLSGKNFVNAASFIEEIKEDDFAKSGIRSLAGVFGMSLVQGSDSEKIIENCRNLQTRLIPSCIEGFVAGFIEAGSPSSEYKKALNFCHSSLFTNSEKEVCFKEALRLSSIFYPKEKQQQICRLVDENFRVYCQ